MQKVSEIGEEMSENDHKKVKIDQQRGSSADFGTEMHRRNVDRPPRGRSWIAKNNRWKIDAFRPKIQLTQLRRLRPRHLLHRRQLLASQLAAPQLLFQPTDLGRLLLLRPGVVELVRAAAAAAAPATTEMA